MKIAILTQPLLSNYGCFLQNFALQTILRRWGYDVKTIDYLPPHTPLFCLILSWMKTIVYRVIGKTSRKFTKYNKSTVRAQLFEEFAKKNLSLTKTVRKYSKKIFKTYNFDCVIVGSDQVWRPIYNHHIQDMFLNFLIKEKIKRIAYAASFGNDVWEFSPKNTRKCIPLAKKFNAISVREKSGVKMCKKNLGINATWVLDPTLLLEKKDYYEVCKNIPIANEKFLIAYVLDENDAIRSEYKLIASERNLSIRFFTSGSNATLSIPQWLAMFRDASYVVTDSFHGTVFSIIFGKEFKCLYNKSRGSARFESLLKLYNMGKIDEMKKNSLNWLDNALKR